jgi:hypothetical protein
VPRVIRFLEVGNSGWSIRDGGYDVYPYEVALSVELPEPLVMLSEGRGHASGGGFFTVADAASGRFSEHLRKAGADWIRPFLERLVAGEEVAECEVVAAFVARHGREPATSDWTVRRVRLPGGGECAFGGPD